MHGVCSDQEHNPNVSLIRTSNFRTNALRSKWRFTMGRIYKGFFLVFHPLAKMIPELLDAIFVAPVQAVFLEKLSVWTAKDTSIT
jgi:hypothetical protein